MSEDITWCGNWDCQYLKCKRNPKHIKLPIDHSYALLEGTEDCYKTQNGLKDEAAEAWKEQIMKRFQEVK